MHTTEQDTVHSAAYAAKDQDESCEACCTEQVYKVTKEDLPLSCPTGNMKLWNGHPRVYLPIEETGTAQCPYCGAYYQLVDKK